MSILPNQALRELYLDCHGELEAVLFLRVHCRETAADICQESFVRLCRVDDLEKVDHIKAYLYRTAMNLLFDHFRRQSIHTDMTVE